MLVFCSVVVPYIVNDCRRSLWPLAVTSSTKPCGTNSLSCSWSRTAVKTSFFPNDFQFDDDKDARGVSVSSVIKEYVFKKSFSKRIYWTKPCGTNSLSCSWSQTAVKTSFFLQWFSIWWWQRCKSGVCFICILKN